MTRTKHEKPESLTAEELQLVTGGAATQPVVVCKLPVDPAETYCGTKGPGPHIPMFS